MRKANEHEPDGAEVIDLAAFREARRPKSAAAPVAPWRVRARDGQVVIDTGSHELILQPDAARGWSSALTRVARAAEEPARQIAAARCYPDPVAGQTWAEWSNWVRFGIEHGARPTPTTKPRQRVTVVEVGVGVVRVRYPSLREGVLPASAFKRGGRFVVDPPSNTSSKEAL